jgi:hypothetical protein
MVPLCGANRNDRRVKIAGRTDWRASLVPAAAVIPAPIAYIKVVAVKTLVVSLLRVAAERTTVGSGAISRVPAVRSSVCGGCGLL